MAKVNPENDTVSDESSNKHSTSFNLDGLTGRDSEYPMLLSGISNRMYLDVMLQLKFLIFGQTWFYNGKYNMYFLYLL